MLSYNSRYKLKRITTDNAIIWFDILIFLSDRRKKGNP